MPADEYQYLEGFNNHHTSEALPDSLPKGSVNDTAIHVTENTLKPDQYRPEHATKMSIQFVCRTTIWDSIYSP